jgi:hypothetical protein
MNQESEEKRNDQSRSDRDKEGESGLYLEIMEGKKGKEHEHGVVANSTV